MFLTERTQMNTLVQEVALYDEIAELKKQRNAIMLAHYFQDELRAQGVKFQTVTYINSTAAVKALSDWIVTSGNAREIIERVPKDHQILFTPDQHLGRYLMEETKRPFILWKGSCMVHEVF